jgi:hypothetical protein
MPSQASRKQMPLFALINEPQDTGNHLLRVPEGTTFGHATIRTNLAPLSGILALTRFISAE